MGNGRFLVRRVKLQESRQYVDSAETEATGHSRRNSTTPAAVGRREGLCCQQLSTISHTESSKPNTRASCGRAGILPLMICEVTNVLLRPLNGFRPVKAYAGVQMLENYLTTRAKTDLYHDHPKRKHVRFLCYFFAQENLWCGPHGSISSRVGYVDGVHSASD